MRVHSQRIIGFARVPATRMEEKAGDIFQLHFMDSRLDPAGMTTSNQP
jgi:hypothetical protein